MAGLFIRVRCPYGSSCRRAAALLVALSIAAAAAASAEPAPAGPEKAGPEDFGLSFKPHAFAVRASPPLPDPAAFPVQLVLDDDAAEAVFGFGGAIARQFLWFSRFANPGRFALEEIWVLFPSGMDVPLGGEVQLAVYLDPDGDPATGAELLATFAEAIQAKDGDTFSVYSLAPPLPITEPGDVLIGVVNRFFETGVDPPPTRPAALDLTSSQDRSWFALWSGDAADPPELAGAIAIDVLDGAVSGNFMIRGFGTPLPPPSIAAIPALGGGGLALLAGLLGLAGTSLARRSRRTAGP